MCTSISDGPSPARARATARPAASYTASTSLSSIRSAGMPYAAPRTALDATAVEAARGTEIPQSLSSMTKTTGSFHSAARFSDSWKAPWLAAPSPVTATATRSVPWWRKAKACPSAGG